VYQNDGLRWISPAQLELATDAEGGPNRNSRQRLDMAGNKQATGQGAGATADSTDGQAISQGAGATADSEGTDFNARVRAVATDDQDWQDSLMRELEHAFARTVGEESVRGVASHKKAKTLGTVVRPAEELDELRRVALAGLGKLLTPD
jgi:hypothetical protein